MEAAAPAIDVLPDWSSSPRPSQRQRLASLARAVPRPAPKSNRRGVPIWFVMSGLLITLAILSVFSRPSTAQWLVAGGGLLAVGTIVEGLSLGRPARLGKLFREPMALVGLGLTFTVAGETMHAFGATFPSAADTVALSMYPLVIIGLLRLTRTRIRERMLDTLLVAAIFPAAAGAFAWMPLVELMTKWVPGAHQQAWVTVAFLVVDALAMAMVGRLALLFRGRPVAFQLLLGAFGCLLGAHVSRAAATVTDVIPAPFGSQTLLLVGFALVAGAAVHPSLRGRSGPSARPAPLGPLQVGLLGVTVVVGPAVVIYRYADVGNWVIAAVGGPALVSLLVVAHLARLVRERSELEHASTHDPLTGLANRGHFHDQVTLRVVSSRSQGFAVGFLDLDRFKKINDSLGHDAGDELLRQVAERLSGAVRRHDVVARLAGDEFGLLLDEIDGHDEAVMTAQRLLDEFTRPFEITGHDVFVTPSIGLALWPEHGQDAETLLRHADGAMYRVKNHGRNGIEVFSVAHGAQAHQQLALESRLHTAIDGGELVLHYQPKLDLGTGHVTGAEALVRWRHPDLGLVPPNAFIETAEDTGLVAPLGEWVLREACNQAARWRAAGHELTVSVNLSARQFQLQDVPAIVGAALHDADLPARLLELELTERISLDTGSDVAAALTTLSAMGVRCSIDDFGTGHSGVGYLTQLPIDTIKLDKTFIDEIVQGPGDAPLVRALVAMAHSLGLHVIAEGVESDRQLHFLQSIGCDAIQGYLLSRPLTEDDFDRFLDGNGATASQIAPAERALDAEALGDLLWREADRIAPSRVIPLPQEPTVTVAGVVRRTLVLSGATAALGLPLALGLGAAGALPPDLQQTVAMALGDLGVAAPDPAHGIRPDGRLSAPEQVTAMAGHQAPVATPVAAPMDDDAKPVRGQWDRADKAGPPRADHGKAGADHGAAGTPHGKADAEHGKAGAEHGKAGAAHGQAGAAHGQAGEHGQGNGKGNAKAGPPQSPGRSADPAGKGKAGNSPDGRSGAHGKQPG
jgi:diguanylate cyclase (GGDEF)-like protein